MTAPEIESQHLSLDRARLTPLTPPLSAPKVLDPSKAFEQLAASVAEITREADGLVVGLSGTDSFVTLNLLAKAAELHRDRLPDEVIAIHYGSRYDWAEALAKLPLLSKNSTIKCVNLITENTPRVGDPAWLHPERHIWGALQTYALDKNFWIVGTRNRTESELGTFSLASTVAVVQPLVHLWKGDILKLAEHLGAPEGMLHGSRCGDGQCGRPTVAAENIEKIDQILMVEAGELDPKYLEQYDARTMKILNEYVRSTREKYHFKHQVPYTPDASVLKDAYT